MDPLVVMAKFGKKSQKK